MPDVSVVIPAYNAERFLGETLDSVLASTVKNLEVIVIDDGSNDRTADVADRYGDPVRVIRQANAGMSASRNRGIAEARSPLIALIDSDDLWHPQKLALQMKAMEADPRIGLAFTEFFPWTGMERANFVPEPLATLDPRLSGWIYDKMLLTNWVLPSSALLRREVFELAGPFVCQHQQTDDWEYFARVSRDWKFVKLAASLVAYRQTPGSLSRRIAPVNLGENMREHLIERFGLQSPQGQYVDANELTRRRHKGWQDFVDSHLARGSLWIGAKGAARILLRGPNRLRTTGVLANSLRRRFFPRAEPAPARQ